MTDAIPHPRQPARCPFPPLAKFRRAAGQAAAELPHPALHRHADRRGRARRCSPTPPPKCRRIISSGRTGEIDQLVPEAKRAWHAGKASGRASATSIRRRSGSRSSIPAMTAAAALSRRQIAATIALVRDIAARAHPARERARPFRPRPARKRDPGEAFPWGAWRAPASAIGSSRRRSSTDAVRPGQDGPPVRALQAMLALYG